MIGLHAIPFVGLAVVVKPVDAASDSIEISISGPQGEQSAPMQEEVLSQPAAPQQMAVQAVPVDNDKPPPDKVEPPPETLPEKLPDMPPPPERVAAPPPKVETPDATELPVPPPPPPPPTPVAVPEAPPPPPPPQEAITKPQGEKTEAPEAAAKATYTKRIWVAIRSRVGGLPSAHSAVVEFAIDGTGVMTSVTIKQSSGNATFDAAALRIVRSAKPGPPPGGAFAGTVTVKGEPD